MRSRQVGESAMIDRRRMLGRVALVALVPLAGCVTGPRGIPPSEGVRRLVSLSTQRALARLTAPDGFLQNQLARIPVPASLRGGSGLVGVLLHSQAVQREIAVVLNRVASRAVPRATDILLAATGGVSDADALAALRAGPTGATRLVQQRVGDAVFDVLLPGVRQLLESELVTTISAAIAEKTGIDYAELGRTLAGQASDGLFRTIGEEETAIRADPTTTRDPGLATLLRSVRG